MKKRYIIMTLVLMLSLAGCQSDKAKSEGSEMVEQEDFSLKEEETDTESISSDQQTTQEHQSQSEQESTEESSTEQSVEEQVASTEQNTAEQQLQLEQKITEEQSNTEQDSAEEKMTEDNHKENTLEEQVATLSVAQKSNQLIIVSVASGKATVRMFQKEAEGKWNTLLETNAVIGKNGIGKTKEGDHKTPRGAYTMSMAFGNKTDPGTALPYTKVDDSWYWVDDVNSAYYNQFVTTQEVTCDWKSAEHIAAVKGSYNYAIAVDYNTSCTKGAGSAIFLHCKPSGGAGCIAVDEDIMLMIMKSIQPGCMIVIDDEANIITY